MGLSAVSRFGYSVSLGKIYRSECAGIFDWHLAGASADAGYCDYAGQTMFAILFYRVNRQREMELEIAKLNQDQAEILERDYQALRRTYADNAKLYHDLHNHIEAIYQCLAQGDIQEAVQYCEELRTPVRKISQTVWTGDKAIDYLISSKMALAEQKHIQTKVN